MLKISLAVKITVNNVDADQSILLGEVAEFNKNTKLRKFQKKKQKRDNLDSVNTLFDGREIVLNAFKSRMFQLPPIEGRRCPSDLASCLKVLTRKQMLQIYQYHLHK